MFLRLILPVVLLGLIGWAGFIYHDFSVGDLSSIGMFFLTYSLVVFSYEALEKSRKESYLESRPYLIADFESDHQTLYFYIKNIGKTSAYDVKVSVRPDILLFGKISFNSEVFKNKINFFPPNKVIKTTIGQTFDFHKVYSELNLVIYYKDPFGKTIEETIKLDLSYRKRLMHVKKKGIGDIVKSLNGIKHGIDQLNKTSQG